LLLLPSSLALNRASQPYEIRLRRTKGTLG
jgi:hypothetical protein